MATQFTYSLTFAGIPFVLDIARTVRMDKPVKKQEASNQLPPRDQQIEADLVDELNRIIPFQYLEDFYLPEQHIGRNLSSMARHKGVGPQPNPHVKIGDWYYPTTASRWGVFRGLATSGMAASMLNATNGSPGTFVMNCVPVAPNTNGKSYSLSTQMYMLPPRPLAEHGGKFDGLYLITLVDERYYWTEKAAQLKPITNQTTWQSLITSIATTLGVTITLKDNAAAYTNPEADSQFWTSSSSASFMLDAIAYNLGCTVVRALDGSYTIQNAVTSQGVVNTNRGNALQVVRTAGGDLFGGLKQFESTRTTPVTASPINEVLPASVTVTFPKYITGDDPVPHLVNSRYQNQRPSAWIEDSYGDTYQLTIPISQTTSPYVTGLTGTSLFTYTVHNTAKALYLSENQLANTPLNNIGLTSLASQIATDYYNNQAAAALDEVYPGTYAWTPEGIHDIIWTWSARDRRATTRVMKTQWNQAVTEMQHTTPNLPNTTQTQRGVGGQSVAQSWTDSFSGSIINTTTYQSTASGDQFVYLNNISFLPTQNRWRGVINSGQTDQEIIMFEGTSGGALPFGNGYQVNVVYRGIDNTIQQAHNQGSIVNQVLPDANYGVNLVRTEKAQFIYPSDWTSGGIQGVNVVPQTQSVYLFENTGTIINSALCYSGQILIYDTSLAGFKEAELVWVTERSNFQPTSGRVYDGQFAGFSALNNFITAPVYLIDEYTQNQSLNSTGDDYEDYYHQTVAYPNDPTPLSVDLIGFGNCEGWQDIGGDNTPVPGVNGYIISADLIGFGCCESWTTPSTGGGGNDVGCRVSPGSQTISLNTTQEIAFTSGDADYDTGSFTSAANVLTFAATGKYYVWFNARISIGSNPPTQPGGWNFAIIYNGVLSMAVFGGGYQNIKGFGCIPASNDGFVSVMVEDDFSATDTVEFQFINNDLGSTATVSSITFGARKVDKAG